MGTGTDSTVRRICYLVLPAGLAAVIALGVGACSSGSDER